MSSTYREDMRCKHDTRSRSVIPNTVLNSMEVELDTSVRDIDHVCFKRPKRPACENVHAPVQIPPSCCSDNALAFCSPHLPAQCYGEYRSTHIILYETCLHCSAAARRLRVHGGVRSTPNFELRGVAPCCASCWLRSTPSWG